MTNFKKEVIELLNKHPDYSNAKIAKILKQKHSDLTAKTESYRKRVGEIRRELEAGDQDKPKSTYEQGKNFINVICASERMLTKEDVIKQFNIDTDIWEVEKFEVKTSEGYRKDRSVKWLVKDGVVKNGEVHDSGKMLVVPLYHVKVRLVKRQNVVDAQHIIDKIFKKAEKYSPKCYNIKHKKKKEGLLLEADIPDLHLGMLSWGKESSGDWDIKIAKKAFHDTLEEILDYASNFYTDQILFPIGNDFFSSDNKEHSTANGTPQDEDVRWQKSFEEAIDLMIRGIDLMQTVAPVDILIVPGNHDFQRTYYLGKVLSAWYKNCNNVKINDSPRLRKYYQYGDNLIGYTHGKDEKPSNLPTIMAHEVPQLWANTKYREWRLGHYHHKKDIQYISSQEFIGIVVRYLRSLTPSNAWATQKGFIGAVRAGEAFLWHKTNGLIAQFTASFKP